MSSAKTQAKTSAEVVPAPVIDKQPNTPEKQGGPSPAARIPASAVSSAGGIPSLGHTADLMTAPEQGHGVASRARMMTSMQQTVGNAHVSRMMDAAVQTKLTVGTPNDVYEQEADQVADRVMRMPMLPLTEPAGSSFEAMHPSEQIAGVIRRQKKTGATAAETKAGPTAQQAANTDLERIIAAIVLAEAWPGQEKNIVWIYYNRWVAQKEQGLNASVAYRDKGMWYKVWMVALGDPTYANHKAKRGDPEKYKDLADYVQNDGWFKTVGQNRANRVQQTVEEVFKDPGKNPYKGWLGQGNLSDFNRDTDKWKAARKYFYLQQQGKVKETYVKELPASEIDRYSYIFDETAIQAFFKKNPGLLGETVEKYQPK